MKPNPETVRNMAVTLWPMSPAAQGDALAKIAGAVANHMVTRVGLTAPDAAEFAEDFTKQVCAEMADIYGEAH